MKKLLSATLALASLGLNAQIDFLYKVISVEQWEQSSSKSYIVLSSMDNDFIHFSTQDQLERIVQKFWAQAPAYIVLTIDPTKLPGRLVFEANPGGLNKYYHLYEGSIPKEAIIDRKTITQ